jgi:hypothetical protein
MQCTSPPSLPLPPSLLLIGERSAECLDLLWEEGHTPSEILDTLRAVPLVRPPPPPSLHIPANVGEV